MPTFPFFNTYRGIPPGAPMLLTNVNWWRGLNDPVLNALVEKALDSNLTLSIARERVTEAAAALRTVPDAASLTPRSSLRHEGEFSGGALVNGGNTATASLDFSWLLDPWGGRRETVKSAAAQIEVAQAEVNAAQLLVLLNLANAYIDLRYQQRLLALREQELAARRKTLSLTRKLAEANAATRLDIVRAEAVEAEIAALLPGLRATIATTTNQIAVLLGLAPGTLPQALASGLAKPATQPRARLSPDVGIPADLLRNRPDIRIAERQYYAAVADIGAARAGLYPTLSLSGSISTSSTVSLSGSRYFFGPAVQFPDLLSKTPGAQVSVRESRARQAHTTWQSTVIDGIAEVESALTSYAATNQSVRASERTVRLYNDVVKLTRQLIDSDGATLNDLIIAETDSAQANISLADALRAQARGFVTLNISIGSGSSYRSEAGSEPTAPGQTAP